MMSTGGFAEAALIACYGIPSLNALSHAAARPKDGGRAALVRRGILRRQLGPVQKLVLRHLATSEHGTWHAGTAWIWDDRTTMIRVLSSLERQGLIEKFDHHQHAMAYRITELGRTSARLG
jgi:hypothetical protein